MTCQVEARQKEEEKGRWREDEGRRVEKEVMSAVTLFASP